MRYVCRVRAAHVFDPRRAAAKPDAPVDAPKNKRGAGRGRGRGRGRTTTSMKKPAGKRNAKKAGHYNART